MTFPTAHSTIYRNEAGEVLGWDTPSDEPRDPEDYWERQDNLWGEYVCLTHKCYVNECPADCRGVTTGPQPDHLAHDDEFCCGPHGCCGSCCGTDEDRIRGEWHDDCDERDTIRASEEGT